MRVSWTTRSNQSILKEINSIFIGRTDAEAEARILWPPVVKSQFIGKDPDAEKNYGQEEKGLTEDEMVDDTVDSMNMNLRKPQEMVKDREVWCPAVHEVKKSWSWT